MSRFTKVLVAWRRQACCCVGVATADITVRPTTSGLALRALRYRRNRDLQSCTRHTTTRRASQPRCSGTTPRLNDQLHDVPKPVVSRKVSQADHQRLVEALHVLPRRYDRSRSYAVARPRPASQLHDQFGTDLSNDHPISFAYDETSEDLKVPTTSVTFVGTTPTGATIGTAMLDAAMSSASPAMTCTTKRAKQKTCCSSAIPQRSLPDLPHEVVHFVHHRRTGKRCGGFVTVRRVPAREVRLTF